MDHPLDGQVAHQVAHDVGINIGGLQQDILHCPVGTGHGVIGAKAALVKDLADKKANVHDEDLEALVFSEVYRLPDRYRLGNVSVQTTMGSSMPATAAVVIQAGEEEMRRAGFGAGPIDATFNVISQIVSRAPDLEQFSINAITGGTDAQGEVTVRLREGEYSATGRGSDPDIIVASAKAYIDALNRLDHKERDALRTQEATGEPAINTCN